MNTHLYPVPSTSSDLESFVGPFLESTVSDQALNPDTQFLILLFGDTATEETEEARTIVRDYSAEAQQAIEIGQLRVENIDERRLNTFVTSLLFNLIETDRDENLSEILDSDVVSDEDERKIDYYLPRVHQSVSETLEQQTEALEKQLNELFPVRLDKDQARNMNERLEMDIVTSQTIIDYLLLAAGSTEDEQGVLSLVRFLREQKIEDSGYLSGGSDNLAGYQRVISLSYDLPKSRFRDEFQTAQSLYENAATNELFRILDSIDPNIKLGEIYTHQSPVEKLITSQFAGNEREIGERLLRTVNGTRVIENNTDTIESEFSQAKSDLEDALDRIEDEIEKLEAANDQFETDKIILDRSEIERFDGLIEQVDSVESKIIKYLFGYDREQRTSVFTTLTQRVNDYADNLQKTRIKIDDRLQDIESLETIRDQHIRTVEQAYSEIKKTSVAVDLPAEDQVISEFKSAWDNRTQSLEESIPVIDVGVDEDTIDSNLEEWQEQVSGDSTEFDEVAQPVEKLDRFQDRVTAIEDRRVEMRQKLRDIDNLMEDTV